MSQRDCPQRIFTDASRTLRTEHNTGVQRVVRNIYNYIAASSAGVACSTVCYSRGRLRHCNPTAVALRRERLVAMQPDPLAHAPALYRRSAKLACRIFSSEKLRNWLLPPSGQQGIFKLPLKLYRAWLRRNIGELQAQIGEGDLLILPDACWAMEEIWPLVAKARARGAKTVVVAYDLIPVSHPQFVPPKATAAFERYLKHVAKHADMVVAISDTVRRQMECVLTSPEYDTQCQHFASFELGAEFHQPTGKVRDSIQAVFPEDSQNAPHLMVATLDPRKNHHYAMDAFEKVWQKEPTRKLCFIGRVGWLCEDVVERIQNHPRFGKQLFALHDVSDVELNYCYQRARSVVFPSIVEGFGLPIVEALWHGRHVFASDTPIHREVGKDECHYCDLADCGSLAELILAWESEHDETSPSRKSNYRPISWQQSIESLVTQCTEQLYPQARSVESCAA